MTRVTGLQKAAILFISLGAETSSRVLKQGFYDEEIEQISYVISNMDRINPATRDEVLDEFVELHRARQFLVQGGPKYAKEMLEKTVGTSKAADILKRLASVSQAIPFHALRKTDPRHLLSFIREEHPQTIAMILAYLEPENSAAILSSLQPELQAEVARRIAIMERTSPDIVQEVERVLERKLSVVVSEEVTNVGGVKSLVAMLNVADRSAEKSILEELERVDPRLAEDIRQQLFVFEDITKLDDISIQRVLRDVNNKDLAMALRGANEEVRGCIYRNQSQRASQMLKEEIDYMGPVRLKEVEDAQQRIVKVIRSLDEAGEIVISRGGEDAFVV
ncbi:MAG: flagellar motor switch protein FliG [Clostridia bacterium]|nr:flagellar motor switch protein FliG [Clostridia bacterium]MDQ7792517.1 flagellar motor switch protein FliG [Clostridia bacterium]